MNESKTERKISVTIAQPNSKNQYDDPVKDFYFDLKQLIQLSISYTKDRIIQDEPISQIPDVKSRIQHAISMCDIFELIVKNRDVNNQTIKIFMQDVIDRVLENMLFIHAAHGYMKGNKFTQMWVNCRYKLKQIMDTLK